MTRPERLVLVVVLVMLSAMAAGIMLVFTLSRSHAARALAAAPAPVPPTVAELIAVLKGDSVRRYAEEALKDIDPAGSLPMP